MKLSLKEDIKKKFFAKTKSKKKIENFLKKLSRTCAFFHYISSLHCWEANTLAVVELFIIYLF
jgi:hypothetical protein